MFKKIFKLASCVVMASSMMSSAQAANFDFSGNITNHNDVVRIGFSLATDATNVDVWTDSFMSGTNFDPITAVWQNTGSDYTLIGEDDDNDTIAPGQTWFDSGLHFNSLSAGNYLFTIARFPNFAVGSLLSQGFEFDGQAPTNFSAGKFYSVHLSGVDAATNLAQTPVPGAVWLFGSGLMGLIGYSRRKQVQA